MSHELLLVTGPDDARGRAFRRSLVEHAAASVPAAAGTTLVDLPTVAAAVVTTTPAGGSWVSVRQTDDAATVVLALSPSGLAGAQTGEAAAVGAEHAHVRLDIDPGGRVSVRTDGAGLLPAFWSCDGRTLRVSTHLASLVSLGHPADLDPAAVVEYLTLLHPAGERTLLASAQVTGPGCSLVWSGRGQPAVTRRPLFTTDAACMTDDDALALLPRLWSEVVDGVFTRASGRVVQGLSGGLDSRAFAVTAADKGHRPLAYTYGTRENREVVAASAIAQRLSIPHLTIPISPDRMLGGASTSANLLDGAHSPSEMYELWFSDVLKEIGDVVVNGLAGGTLWGDDKAVGITGRDAVASKVEQKYAAAGRAASALLAPELAGQAASTLRAGLTDSMADWDFDARSDAVIYWRMANRQMRWGAMLVNGLRRSGLQLELPFLDSRFLTFAAGLSPRQRLNGRLYLEVHRRMFGRTSDLPRADDGNAPDRLQHVYWSADRSYASQLASMTARNPSSGARRAGRQLAGLGAKALSDRTRVQGPYDRAARRGAVFPAELWVRSEEVYRRRLAAMLEQAQEQPLLNGPALDAAARQLRAGDAVQHPLALGRAAAVGLWSADYARRANASAAVV